MISGLRREYDQKNASLSKKREPTAQKIELSQLKKELPETKLKHDMLRKVVSIFCKKKL